MFWLSGKLNTFYLVFFYYYSSDRLYFDFDYHLNAYILLWSQWNKWLILSILTLMCVLKLNWNGVGTSLCIFGSIAFTISSKDDEINNIIYGTIIVVFSWVDVRSAADKNRKNELNNKLSILFGKKLRKQNVKKIVSWRENSGIRRV